MRKYYSLTLLSLLLLLFFNLGLPALQALASAPGSRTLGVGNTGQDVAALQKNLLQLGYYTGTADGVYGDSTKKGVLSFQAANGLVPDGIAGPLTQAALEKSQTFATNRYRVRAGDSLYWIALRYGTTADAVKQANPLKSELIYPGDYLVLPGVAAGIPWNQHSPSDLAKPLRLALIDKAIPAPVPGQLIVVDKSDFTLSLFSGGAWLKSYQISLGDGGPEDKQVAGDHKTPEGKFYISERLVLNPTDQFLGSRWLRLSYPSPEDAARGLQQGLLPAKNYQAIIQASASLAIPSQQTALGGGIGIHGGSTPDLGANWTWGCIGLSNQDAEEIYDYVGIGSAVVVIP